MATESGAEEDFGDLTDLDSTCSGLTDVSGLSDLDEDIQAMEDFQDDEDNKVVFAFVS